MKRTRRNETRNAASGGVGVNGLLLVAFIVLKLCGVIDWSWWWVLSPAWGTLALYALIFVVAVIVLTIRRCAELKRKDGATNDES